VVTRAAAMAMAEAEESMAEAAEVARTAAIAVVGAEARAVAEVEVAMAEAVAAVRSATHRTPVPSPSIAHRTGS